MKKVSLVVALAPIALLGGVLVIVSCFNPNLGDGGFPCGTGNECPTGYTCATTLGECYKDGVAVPDAGIPDARVGTVEVRVLDDNLGVREPANNRPVAFQDADGHILAVVNTDATGRASFASMPVGGMVTSGLVADGLTAGLQTVVAVAPGDHIVMQGRFGGGGNSPPVVSTINVDIPFEQAGALRYYIDIGCNYQQGTVAAGHVTLTLQADRACIHDDGGVPKINVVAYAVNDTPVNDTPISYTIRADVPVVVSGTTTVLMPNWSTDFLQIETRVTNPPVALPDDGGPPRPPNSLEIELFSDQAQRDFRVLPDSRFEFPGGANPPPFIWKFPRGIHDTITLQLRSQINRDTGYSTLLIDQIATPFPTTPVLLDASNALPGPVRGGMINPGMANWGFAWEYESPPPVRPGLFLFLVGIWLEPPPGGIDAGNDDDLQRFWIVLAPGNLPSPFTYPELPAALDAWRPTPQAQFTVPFTLSILGEVDIFDTYTEVRNEFGPGVVGSDNLLPGRSYQLRISGLFPN